MPRACVATASAIDVRSAGKAGHGPSSIFGICEPRSSRTTSSWRAVHADRRALDRVLDAEALEARPDREQVLGHDVLDHDLAFGDRAEADEARNLDVVRADP